MIVQFNNYQYRAKWWTRGENPELSGKWDVWESLGFCGGATS